MFEIVCHYLSNETDWDEATGSEYDVARSVMFVWVDYPNDAWLSDPGCWLLVVASTARVD
jgi:hypothetical protein